MAAIVLPQELNINTIGEVLAKVRKTIEKSDAIVLDAKDVEIVDALGLQLILSVEKTASMNNIKYQLINANSILQKHLQL